MIQLDNAEFLQTVFHGLAADESIWLCHHSADPQAARNGDWEGRAVKLDALPSRFDADKGQWFGVSSFKRGADGKIAHSKDYFAGLWSVVLDDVEGGPQSLPLSPSWAFETSPGNFQCGYLLSDPVRSLEDAQAVLQGVRRAGVSDPGAATAVRYMRLPQGRNLKLPYRPAGFAHVVHVWEPERRRSLDEIVSGLGLDISQARASGAAGSKAVRKATSASSGSSEALSDEALKSKVLRSPKALRVWDGWDMGMSGSEADEWLLVLLAYQTSDPEQIERVYSASPRAERVSSDGTKKWQVRPDYRRTSIQKALAYVEAHPQGNTEEAAETVREAIERAKASGDARGVYAPEVLEALQVLQVADRPTFDHLKKEARSAGAKLGTLDCELRKLKGETKLLDLDAAHLAIEAMGGAQNLIHTQASWFKWTGAVWERFESDEPIKRVIVETLPKSQVTAACVGSVLSLMRTLCASDAAMDPKSSDIVIACANGELVLEGAAWGPEGWTEGRWVLRDHRREGLRTSVLPVAWDEQAECPHFWRYLDSITANDSPEEAAGKQRALLEAIGYSLTSSTGLERFVILYGPSASNGKSTLLNLIGKLAGPKNTTALTVSRLSGRFDLARLQGSLVNLCPEIARGEVLPEATVKALVSGDLVTVERKGRDTTDIRPVSTLWFATNTLPSQRDLSPALLDKRCLLIEMTRSFEGDESKDTQLSQKLVRELPGILRACVEAFGRALSLSRMPATLVLSDDGQLQPAGGSGLAPIEDTPSGLRAKAAWKQDSDPVRTFAEDRLVLGAGYHSPSSDLFAAWKAWAEAEGVRLELTSRGFVKRLKGVYPQLETGDTARVGRKRAVRGCALAESE